MKRYQVSAVLIAGGERVTGYPVKYGEAWQIWVEREDGTWNYVIDPATIEPVKVPVICKTVDETGVEYEFAHYICPCCKVILHQHYRKSKEPMSNNQNYCVCCGQALDWTKEETDG